MLALGSSAASAQDFAHSNVSAAVRSSSITDAVGQAARRARRSARRPLRRRRSRAATALQSPPPSRPVSGAVVAAGPTIASEAAWLHHGGWPLYALVDKLRDLGPARRARSTCLATAVYFEARGEIARRPAGGRPGGHEPRRLGQISAELVRDGQAAVRNSRSSAAAVSRPSTPIARRGARPRPWPSSPTANIVPSLPTTCCGITPIMSRRPGAPGSTGAKRSARTSSTAPDPSSRRGVLTRLRR